jgi:hypothetical protein
VARAVGVGTGTVQRIMKRTAVSAQPWRSESRRESNLSPRRTRISLQKPHVRFSRHAGEREAQIERDRLAARF